MDKITLLTSLDFSRARLLGSLDAIEKSGQDLQKVLLWRPGAGRAHLAWQFLHCAATHDRYLNVRLLGGTEKDPAFCAAFAGGSKPADDTRTSAAEIRTKLEQNYAPFRTFVGGLSPADMGKMLSFPNGASRSMGEAIMLMAWHEAHHQGQIHLTWNLYNVRSADSIRSADASEKTR
jgi:hypothetical protein